MKIYSVQTGAVTSPVSRVQCTNEREELHALLERNPNLLPGDQIDPEDPRRWLVVKSEMPVPSPSSGRDCWSVDLVLADQDAIPTFVEVKRYSDTRARREIVGQLLEYAANGHYYWSKEQLRDYAEASARSNGSTLEKRLEQLSPETGGAVDLFFERLQDNLREGQLRLVFFLEEAPIELKSVVDFLNRQMERTEVLLVEARQFDDEGRRYIVPTLFGYSEQARQVKRVVTVTNASQSRKTQFNRESFFAALAERTDETVLAAASKIFALAQSEPVELRFNKSSFGVVLPKLGTPMFISVDLQGKLMLWVEWFRISLFADLSDQYRKRLANIGLAFEDSRPYPTFPPQLWSRKIDELLDVCRELIASANRLSD